MRSDKNFRLRVLGDLALDACVGDKATPASVRPRHLALLSVLALSSRAARRDALATMFWGEETDTRARHSLSNALSALRGVLGPSSISARRDEVALSPDLRLAVDALEFAAAAEMRDDRRAAELYRGPLLANVYVQDAPGFDDWVARERARFERIFLAVCERGVPQLLRTSQWDTAAGVAEQWLHAAPNSTLAFTSVLRARSGPGTPTALRTALSEYERLRGWLAAEHGARPDETVSALITELETQLATSERSMAATLAPPAAAASGQTPAAVPAPASGARTRRRLWPAIVAVSSVVAIVAAGFRYLRPTAAASGGHTIVAVTDVANIHGDSAMNWLEDGLPQIITDNLSSEGGVDVVSQEQVRDVLLRRGTTRDAPLTAQDAMDVARRVGATVEVRGGISGGQGMYVLDVAARDVGTGATLASFTVMSADPVQLGRLAAARLLDVASVPSGDETGTPRFADVATTRPEAYRHYVLALRAASEQRYGDEVRELDAAIALDSGFYGALRDRRDFAAGTGDAALAARLDSAIARHADRMSAWDRQVAEIHDAYSSGGVERSEALAARLVRQYPRDPRAYDIRGSMLAMHGRWLAADSVYQQELSLDSLAIEAGNGPCAPCDAYSGLVNVRLQSGDVQGAEQAARRWVALQPGIPGAWEALSMVLGFTNRGTEAGEAARRAAALSSDPVNLAFMGRNLIVGHRFSAVDSLIAAMRARPGARDDADDLAATLARERGQFRRAIVELQPTIPQNGLRLVQADNLMRAGRVAEARREYELAGHEHLPRDVETLTAEQARAFTWAHALEGDALWRIGDTSATRALLDSVRTVGARSYYGRDWNLYRHLDGLLALSAGDTAQAVRELSAARFGVSGWTTTVVELGRIQLARGNAAGAIALFRQALEGPLDAMGRYVPRSEIEYDLARAFARAGEADSARAYAQWVRTAWRDADPEVRAKLSRLPN